MNQYINLFLFFSIALSIIFVFLPLFIYIPQNFYKDAIDESKLIIHKNKSIYNLGDQLLIPKNSGYADWIEMKEHDHYRKTINDYPDSFLAIYESLRKSPDELIPNIENIQKGIDVYIERNKSNKEFMELLHFVNNKDVLCVHVRSGDYGEIKDEFKNIIIKLKNKFKYVVIMCGIHNDPSNVSAQYTLIDSIKKIFGEENDKQNIFISIEDPDVHLSMFRSCQNLLLHKNGFSILAGFIFKGDKLFMCKEILYESHNFENPEGIGLWSKHLQPENNQINQIIYL
jgi:hypothetical protein